MGKYKKALDHPRASIMAINKKLIAWENSFAILLVIEAMLYDIILRRNWNIDRGGSAQSR
jgi:hypothetical protein